MPGEAQRIVNVIGQVVEKNTANGARIQYTPAVIHDGSGAYTASAYIWVEEFLEEIGVPAGAYVSSGDYVVLGISGEGRAWVERVLPTGLYAKMVADFNRGRIGFGDGTEVPEDFGTAGQSLLSGGTGASAYWGAGSGGGVTDHGALTGLGDDDHTGYQKESEKGAALGYASLDAGTKVPVAQLGGGTPDGTKFLRDDQTFAVPSGTGAPATADYLVGTAQAGLSAEIPVGATPGGELGGTWASPTVDPTHSGSAHLPWFNVKSYGATGDGSTDDTSSVNSAIAALNTATRGVLYFPAATTYKCTSALTTITASGLVLGDGGSVLDPASKVTQTSASADLFTVSGDGLSFQGLHMQNTSGGATTSDGIIVTGGAGSRYVDCTVAFFRDGIQFTGDSKYWVIDRCWIENDRYGVNNENTTNPDAGDWGINQSVIGFNANGGVGIFMANGGGGRIIGNKINAGSRTGCVGIQLDIDGTDASGVLLIEDNSIENCDTNGVLIETSDTATWSSCLIVGNQFGLWSNTAGTAITADASVAGAIARLVISNNTFHAATANTGPAVVLENIAGVRLAANVVTGFDSYYTATTCTNLTDDESGHQIDYAEITTSASITGTTEGAATAIVSAGARTYDGLTTVLIEFYAYAVQADNGAVNRTLRIGLFDSTTGIGIIHLSNTQVATVNALMTVYAARRITPTAGAHTFNAKGWVSAGTGTIGAGAGGANTPMPCFIRVSKIA